MPYLNVTLADSDFQRTCPLEDNQELAIGRSPDCDLHIAHRSLSREHCKISPCEDGWELIDCDSTNGTQVNGHRLMGNRQLKEGDVIKAGVLIAAYHEHMLSDNAYATTYPALDVPSAIQRKSEAVENNIAKIETETHSVELVNNDEITIDTDDCFIDIDDEGDGGGNSLWDDNTGEKKESGDSLWLD